MAETPRPPHTDMQKLSDSSADLYEAIATLEFTGRTVNRSQIAAATGLSVATVAEYLRVLVEHDFVLEQAAAPEPVYVPARRGWSAVPTQATGKPLSSGGDPGDTAAPPYSDDRQAARLGDDDALAAAGSSALPPVSWSDSGSIAVISWSTADGQAFQREVADQQEAARLLQSIEDDDQLALVSAQVRRVGIGPDS
jgi:hypothetical protein